jgi:predicted GNAT family acetyltransferase
MKKSELRHLIREEIKKAYSVNENVPDDGNVYGWYWPIADQAMEMIKTDSKYSGASLGAVGSGDGVTYITITVDLPSGSEEHFVVNFDENRQATDIESTFISEELEGEGTYRVYMNSDPDEPERINYEIYFGDGTKAEMIKQAKEMAYSNDPTNQYGDPILVVVTHEDYIDDVAWTNIPANEGFTKDDWDLKWKLPKDNLFNASKTIDAVNNRSNAIQDLLKLNSKELQSFDNDDEHPATNMSYNELMRWYYQVMKESVNEEINTDIVNRNINLLDKAADMAIKNPKGNVVELAKIIKKYISGIRNSMKESVNEGLPPGYAKFLVSLQTLIGDIAPNAWGNKSQITSSSVKRVHNSLKKRYGDDYAKFNDLLKTQKGQFGNWYLNEPVNEAEFKHINPSENKIKDAIKDVEKKFRLKANRDNPPQYAQLSLNKIMLSKVLGREELGKEHQGAWEKLKKEYNLRDAVNEADQYVDARGNFKLRNGLEVKIKSASEIQKLNMNEDYMKYNLQIAGKTVKIEKAFRGEFGGAPSEFTVKGYKAFETRSTGKPRKGFTQSIIGDVVRDEVSEGPGQKHYTKDGKEWKGKTHKMPDGTLMTQNPHNKDSEELSHK